MTGRRRVRMFHLTEPGKPGAGATGPQGTGASHQDRKVEERASGHGDRFAWSPENGAESPERETVSAGSFSGFLIFWPRRAAEAGLESRAARPSRFLPAPSTRDGDRMRHEGSGIGRLDSKDSGLETRDPGPAGRRPVFAKTNRTSRKRASQNRLRGRLDGLTCVLSPVGTPAGGSDRPPAFGQEIDPTGFGDRRGLTASKDPVPTGLRRAVGLRKRSPPDSRDTSTRDLGFGTGMAPEAPSVERREGPRCRPSSSEHGHRLLRESAPSPSGRGGGRKAHRQRWWVRKDRAAGVGWTIGSVLTSRPDRPGCFPLAEDVRGNPERVEAQAKAPSGFLASASWSL